MYQFKEDCCFCLEFLRNEVDNEIKKKYSITNRILFDNDKFVVLPSVSPVVEKHLLILPKTHINTMKQMADDDKKQLLLLIKRITSLFGEDYFLFEHGAFPVNGNTCGVDHAHIHILPLDREVSESVIGFLTKSFEAKLYNDLFLTLNDVKDMPYLLYGNDIHGMYSCNNANFPSQFLRKILCDKLGINTWNWRGLTNKHYFSSAFSELKGKFYG